MVEARDASVQCDTLKEVLAPLKAEREMANSSLRKNKIHNFDDIRTILNGAASELTALDRTFNWPKLRLILTFEQASSKSFLQVSRNFVMISFRHLLFKLATSSGEWSPGSFYEVVTNMKRDILPNHSAEVAKQLFDPLQCC